MWPWGTAAATGDGGATFCGRARLIPGKVTDGSEDVLCYPARLQSCWKNKSNKWLSHGKLLRCAGSTPEHKNKGVVGPGAMAVLQHLSLPLRRSTSPAANGSFPTGTGGKCCGRGWWAAAFPGGGLCVGDVFTVPSSASFHGCCGPGAPSVLLKSTSSQAAKTDPGCNVLGRMPGALFAPQMYL